MWIYEKKLQFPVNIKNPDPKAAKIIVSQLGGPDGEIGASLRYLNQRYAAPYGEVVGILTDVGLSAMILHLYTKIGKAYCFQYALPFSLYHFKT